MYRKLLATTALSLVLTGGAFAQDAQDQAMPADEGAAAPAGEMAPAGDAAAQPAAEGEGEPIATAEESGINADGWLASELMGQTIYNSTADDAEAIGDVNDFVLDQDGEIGAIVVGVGGFLGIGQKSVAINWEDLEMATDPNGGQRLVANMSREQLESAQEFNAEEWLASQQQQAAAPAAGGGAMAPAEGDAMAPAEGDQGAMAPEGEDAAAPAEGDEGAMTPAEGEGDAAAPAEGEDAAAPAEGDEGAMAPAEGEDAAAAPAEGEEAAAPAEGNEGAMTPAEGQGDAAAPAEGEDAAAPAEGDEGAMAPAEGEDAAAPAEGEEAAAPAEGEDAAAPAEGDEAAAPAEGDEAAMAPAEGDAAAPAEGGEMAAGPANFDEFETVATGDISAEDLTGTPVYGAEDEQIASIGDIILSEEGSVQAVIVDFGGFLGIGTKPVAIAYDNLEFYRDAGDNLVLRTPLTAEDLEAAPEYNEETYADAPDDQLVTME